MMLLSEHFEQAEFLCKCGRQECDAPLLPHPQLVNKLEDLRVKIGFHPIKINSGLRCSWYNNKEGGKKDSAHLIGQAADLACPDSITRYEMMLAIPHIFSRFGIGKTFIHVDISTILDQKVCWLYE